MQKGKFIYLFFDTDYFVIGLRLSNLLQNNVQVGFDVQSVQEILVICKI